MHTPTINYFLFVFSFILIPSTIFSEPLQIDKALTNKNIIRFSEYFEDTQGELDINDVTAPGLDGKWYPFAEGKSSFGITQSVYWVRFTANNIEDIPVEFYIQQKYSPIDSIIFFIPEENNTYTKLEAGDTLPFNKRPLKHRTFVFPLRLEAKSSKTYYMRFQSQGAMNLVLSVWMPKAFHDASLNEYIVLVFFYGIIFIMVVYNFFIFLFSRDLGYLYYVCFIVFSLLFMMEMNGTAYQFLWPNSPRWENYMVLLSNGGLYLFGLLFAKTYMQMKRTDPFSYKVTQIIFYITAICLISTLFTSYRISITLLNLFGIIVAVWIMAAGIKLALKKNRIAYFYITAWALFLTGGFAHIGKTLGVLPTNFFTVWAMQVGLAAQVTLLSLGLADKINQMRKNLKSLNLHLEDKVKERTVELSAAMDEATSANEMLTIARDHLWGEMELAKKIQTVLLPENPTMDGFQIATYMEPANEVGGDYYDIIDVDGKYWLVIGDVSGHGMAAGLIMMMVQTSIQLMVRIHPDYKPSELLTAINKTITNNIKKLKEDKYMTITVIACISESLFSFSGLHQNMLIFRSKTGDVEIIETNGIWLGIADDIYGINEDFTMQMNRGDILLLYTDGITEATKLESVSETQGEKVLMYGEDNLIANFTSLAHKEIDEIKKGLICSLNEYKCDDDVTFVILKNM